MLEETTTKSFSEHPTLQQVFQILMDHLWKYYYPASATRDSVVDLQLRSCEAKYWLLAKANAIWIVHCSEPSDDMLRGFLERIVDQIFWAFLDFPEFEVFEIIHDRNDLMIPRMRGATKAGEHFNIPESTPTSVEAAPLRVGVRENRCRDRGDDGNLRDRPLAKGQKHKA